jgi:hypothetical protein
VPLHFKLNWAQPSTCSSATLRLGSHLAAQLLPSAYVILVSIERSEVPLTHNSSREMQVMLSSQFGGDPCETRPKNVGENCAKGFLLSKIPRGLKRQSTSCFRFWRTTKNSGATPYD